MGSRKKAFKWRKDYHLLADCHMWWSRHLGIFSCQPLQACRQLFCWTMQHMVFFLHLWACAKDKKGCPSNISNKEKSNMLKKKRKCCISNYWKTSMSTENYYWNCWKMLKITAEKCWTACLMKNYWNSWKCYNYSNYWTTDNTENLKYWWNYWTLLALLKQKVYRYAIVELLNYLNKKIVL